MTLEEFTVPNESIKAEICSIGRRIYEKGFAAANEGNISFRTGENEILCTPSLQSKGFLTPEDICTIDMEGNQTAGKKKRTSEVLLHLEVYRNRPDIKCAVHCHPPHATAFAIAGEPIPVGVLPEPEIFLGEVPTAPYHRPGTKEFAESIVPFVKSTKTIVLANHGTLSYGETLERAFWWTDILDAYCRILILAKQLGGVRFLNREQGRELLKLRGEWGFEDPRSEIDNVDVGQFAAFGDTWSAANLKPTAFANPDAELVERIAQRVAELLRSDNS